MEIFRKFLEFIDFYTETKVDFVAKLPLEISSIILSMLDAQSFQSAAKVSHRWRNVCRYEEKRRQAHKNKITTLKCSNFTSTYAARKRHMKNILFGEEYKNCIVIVAPYFNNKFLPSSQATLYNNKIRASKVWHQRHRFALRTIRL